MTAPMVEEIVAALEQIEADDGVGRARRDRRPAGVLRGRQPRQPPEQRRSRPAHDLRGLPARRPLPLPTLAAVNGATVRAGMNLALACDVRLAARRARFDTRFLQIGLHPGGGHTWLLRGIVGPQAAAAAVLFGEVLDGPEAERVGLAYRCVDDDALLASAQEMAARAADAPRELSIVTKQTLRDMATVADHPAAVERRARAAGVERRPALVRRAHRRPPGQDLEEAAVGGPPSGEPEGGELVDGGPPTPRP